MSVQCPWCWKLFKSGGARRPCRRCVARVKHDIARREAEDFVKRRLCLICGQKLPDRLANSLHLRVVCDRLSCYSKGEFFGLVRLVRKRKSAAVIPVATVLPDNPVDEDGRIWAVDPVTHRRTHVLREPPAKTISGID